MWVKLQLLFAIVNAIAFVFWPSLHDLHCLVACGNEAMWLRIQVISAPGSLTVAVATCSLGATSGAWLKVTTYCLRLGAWRSSG